VDIDTCKILLYPGLEIYKFLNPASKSNPDGVKIGEPVNVKDVLVTCVLSENVNLQIVLLILFATYKFQLASNTNELGALNCTPLISTSDPIVPDELMTIRLLLAEFTTYNLLLLSNAMHVGLFKTGPIDEDVG
jgi:hypothetical protein